MKYRRSAEITVFLTLIFSILIGLVLVAIKSAESYERKLQIELITDSSINSAFSEYNKSLFDNYELLYVDTTYKGQAEGGRDSFLNHLSQYAYENMPNDLSLSAITLENEHYADDNNSFIRMIEDSGRSIDEYILEMFSYRNNKKAISINEYEIEYILTGKYEEMQCSKESELTDGDFISQEDDFISNEDTLNDEEYKDFISNELSGMETSIKIIRAKDVITLNMRDKYNLHFDFSKHIEKCEITFLFEDTSGFVFSCKR